MNTLLIICLAILCIITIGPLQHISPSFFGSRFFPVDTSTILNVVFGTAKPHDPSRGASSGFNSASGESSDIPQP